MSRGMIIYCIVVSELHRILREDIFLNHRLLLDNWHTSKLGKYREEKQFMAPRFVDKFLTTRSINYVTVTMGIASEKVNPEIARHVRQFGIAIVLLVSL